MVYMIAEKRKRTEKIISVVLAIIALLVLVLVGDFSHYQLFTAGLSIWRLRAVSFIVADMAHCKTQCGG